MQKMSSSAIHQGEDDSDMIKHKTDRFRDIHQADVQCKSTNISSSDPKQMAGLLSSSSSSRLDDTTRPSSGIDFSFLSLSLFNSKDTILTPCTGEKVTTWRSCSLFLFISSIDKGRKLRKKDILDIMSTNSNAASATALAEQNPEDTYEQYEKFLHAGR